MLNGLDLFSGIGGISVALRDWVRPIAYCEIDPYCQGVLLSRMADGSISRAPIWDDVTTLEARCLFRPIDIIYGGFPRQDISIAGRGKGLEGERSGLFFEIMRLAKEIQPKFLFLETVPAITRRGGWECVHAISALGYDCRWCVISAASVGALHKRERWFLLGYSKHDGSPTSETLESFKETVRGSKERAHKACELEGSNPQGMLPPNSTIRPQSSWDTEPPICRVATRVPFAMERIRALGNSVVARQAKEAFKILMGV